MRDGAICEAGDLLDSDACNRACLNHGSTALPVCGAHRIRAACHFNMAIRLVHMGDRAASR